MKRVRIHVQRGDGGGTRSAGRVELSAIRRAAMAALAAMDVTEAEISITLLGDDAIADLNQRFLRHTGPTDVLSFPLWEDGEFPVGDVYIGIEQAIRQAETHDVPLREELARLAIHGALHVLGMDHPEDQSRTASEMWIAQERILESVMQS
jgi:probable rRNA maturation factor